MLIHSAFLSSEHMFWTILTTYAALLYCCVLSVNNDDFDYDDDWGRKVYEISAEEECGKAALGIWRDVISNGKCKIIDDVQFILFIYKLLL